MPFKKKAEHIWEYYRWQILVTLVVVFFLGTWIRGIVTEKEPLMQVEMINAYGNTPDGEAFEDFLQKAGREYYEDAVIVNTNIQMNGPDPTANYASAQMLFCSLAAAEPDLIFWETDEIMPQLDGGQLLDLRELLPEAVLKEYEDSLVYATMGDTEESYPCGIYLERNPWIMENKYYVNCTASVSASCKDRDLAVQFLLYMLSWEK